MKREDFIFTVGYDGNTALVDAGLTKKFKKSAIDELLQEGLYKQAFCAALFDESEEEMEKVKEYLGAKFGVSYKSEDQLKRLFGVFPVTDESIKVSYL